MSRNLWATALACGALFTGASAEAYAGCLVDHVTESDSTFPSTLQGKLAYHTYGSYGDGASQIFIYDFAARKVTQASSSSWGIQDPMNAVFSPDGQWLAFMGIKDDAWNIFMWRVDSADLPVNLTKSTGETSNEDPKFSADGTALFFKQDGDVIKAALSFENDMPVFSSQANLTHSSSIIESSMPYPSADGKLVFYAAGKASGLMGVYRLTLATGKKVVFDKPNGLEAYYPTVRQDGRVFYSRWKDSGGADQLYTKVNPSDKAEQLSINDCDSNNSDAFPVNGTDYVFFSSTTEGKYQLYLGEVSTGKRWSLSSFHVNDDTDKETLGANYFGG
ncbi:MULTISPECIES: PD40 domain-containing protein [Lonsdalea]|nr:MULTISPECIES: PD40 domain-containing protein [Lonsdalea]QPQ24577.1 PD40 domain-containing protein [Lonsdalea populi]ROH76077.1 hypothetical protein EC393_14540 [Lonsdalea populi]ROH77629.1 hypothetical protein EC394_14715 [Lonsdalea populi]